MEQQTLRFCSVLFHEEMLQPKYSIHHNPNILLRMCFQLHLGIAVTENSSRITLSIKAYFPKLKSV